MRIELLYFDGCPSYEQLLPRLQRILAGRQISDEVSLVRIETAEDAVAERFLGSPTVRVQGIDVEPGAARRDDYGMKCRLYQTPAGLRGIPPDELVLRALDEHGDDACR